MAISTHSIPNQLQENVEHLPVKPPKPARMKVRPEGIPQELKELHQWVLWKWEWKEGSEGKEGKWDKPPYQPNRRKASSTNPETWNSFRTVIEAYSEGDFDGIGVVADKTNRLVHIDLDDCIDDLGIELKPWAQNIVDKLNSYTYITPSGEGLRVVVTGTVPENGRRTDVMEDGEEQGRIEIYQAAHYLCVTGHLWSQETLTIEDRQNEVNEIWQQYFGEKDDPQEELSRSVELRSTPLEDWEVIAKAHRAGNGEKFARLWKGDITGYPSQSEADQALCNLLAFWTGKDPEQMDRLFRQSGLYREKWDRDDYSFGRTIAKAIRDTKDVYTVGTEAPWPPRQDLPTATATAPTLNPNLIPEPLRPWIVDVAERACQPLEYVAAPALVALGATIGRQVGIRPGKFDDYLVVPNLWGGIVGRPGTMKSGAVSAAMEPLRRLEARETDLHQMGAADREAQQRRYDAEEKALRSEMERAAKTKNEEEKEESLKQLEEKFAQLQQKRSSVRKHDPRRVTQDATTEKLGELLNENPRGMLLLRDELAGWLRQLEKLGREGDREFYLEAWNGTGSYTFDRIGRGTVRVDALTLSICGGIQPGKLRAYIEGALAEGGEADGLLQRFQVFVWPDDIGEWEPVERWPDSQAKERAQQVFTVLSNLFPTAIGATVEGDRSIPYLRFSEDAQERFNTWRNALETRLRSGEMSETPAFEAHLAKYRSLLPSLALIFHLVDVVDGGNPGPVSLAAMQLAEQWCEYLEAHARKLYAEELSPGVDGAHKLAERIENGDVKDRHSMRELYRPQWAGLRTPEQARRACQVLESCSWLRVQEIETGGRPSEIIRLHPDLCGGQSDE
jgi:hypothetical protein